MATRQQVREVVVWLLYAFDSGNENIQKFIDEILEEKKIRNKQKEFALSLFSGILENLEMVDDTIESVLKEWDFEKLGKMEKAILRLGVFEMLFTDTDRAVIINEAVELAKNYGAENSPKFVNGILDAIKS